MLKFHLFPRDTGIDAVLGPPKLPSGLELRSAALGQFWRPLDGIFSRVPRKKAEFWPRMFRTREENALTNANKAKREDKRDPLEHR